jgi:hypothetical protein
MPVEQSLKPQELLAALKTNPQGDAREELLAQICKKSATAYKAIEQKLPQSDDEKLRLAEAAFVGIRKVANNYYANRANDLLCACGHLSADFRSRVVAFIARDPYSSWYAIWSRGYFPKDAQATTEERKVILKGVAKSPHQAYIALYHTIVKETYKEANLSRDEKRILAPSAVAHILKKPDGSDDKELLAAMRKEDLLTTFDKARTKKLAA